MLNHLPFEKLADLAEDRLSPDQRAAVQSHVSSCSSCAEKLGGLESVIGLMRTDEGEDAPAALVSDAINLFRTRSRVKEPSLIKKIAAALSFDSLRMAPAYGVRSGQSQSRQLLYSAGDFDLDLRLTQSGEAWNVSGQILGEECAGGHVEVVGESASVHADLNEQCEFALQALPAGSYHVHLRIKDLEIEIPQVELRS